MSAVAEPTLLDTIVRTVASTLKIPVERLDVDADFDSFGMDSIIAIELMTNLSKTLKASVTPAQLTAVNSIRELAGIIDGATRETLSAPALKTQPTAAMPTAVTTLSAAPVVGGAAAPRRRPEVRRQPAGSLGRMLAFVRGEYGLDLRGERFTSKQSLIDHLLEHHADALSHYYGLSSDERSAEAPEVQAVALPTGNPGIAVVGMACAFADAKTPEALWHNLIEQRSLIAPLKRNRWGATDANAAPRWGALIDEVDRFDAPFFGLSEAEARLCDPQERLVMQAVYHALQHAGLRADKLRGTRTGLFLGYAYAEYEHHLRRNLPHVPNAPPLSSSSPIYYLANRISFLYDFKGPSEVVNASCASSALAIHRACQSLAQGECDVAICGGVSLNLFEGDYAAIARYGLLSPDGSCGVFDDAANGFTRSEGLGLLVLTRLDDAERDNRRIFAKVVASHQNNRGRASFISEIKHEAITQLIAECYEKHTIAPNSVHYIEVHGYATKWGDSFEFEGIKNAFGAPATGQKHCALGSIKGYIGHTEPASGVASAMKVALSLYHKQFPATITKKTLNTFIDIESSAHPLYIADRALPFDTLRHGDEPIRAGVNSFSDSGVNVHLLFEEYRTDHRVTRTEHSGRQLFVFSGRTRESLQESLALARESLQESLAFYSSHMGKQEPAPALEDLAYTLQLATVPMEHRLAIIAASHKELLEALARAGKLLDSNKPADGNGPIFIGGPQERDNARVFDVIKSQIGEDKLLDNLRKGMLKDIALLWVGGIDMPWDRHWRDVVMTRRRSAQALPQVVDIPPYPFAKNRYWLDFDDTNTLHVEIPTVARPRNTTSDSGASSAPEVVREWRFVDALADGEKAETLDAEDKIIRFLAQETAGLLRMPRAEVDTRLSFHELGFDSVGMASLIQKVISLLGENLSPKVVFDFPGIELLGRHLAETYRTRIDSIHVLGKAAASTPVTRAKPQQTPAPKTDLESWFVSRDSVADDLLVKMQTNASGTPVFAVPGADGSVLSLQTLSRAMAGVRPMFGLEGVGLDGKREPPDSIQAMAEANVAALAGLRDCRALSLLGYSNGAVVAFEMAHQLLKKNISVERLVLVDGRCPASTSRVLTDEIAKVFGNLITAFRGECPLDPDEFRTVPEDQRAGYLFALIRRNSIWMSESHFMLAYRLSVASENACRSYRPKKLPKSVETVVVRATRNNGDLPPSLGWNKFLAKPAVCIDVDADHLSVVGAEGSAVIARIFQ
ncbi:beta-ketoacyl synthase N-terminal-like domain-containing protein [Tahibacter amnicola]|uniref:Phosphopantetheine-binding protein n=1 Tax=Tahibacter amnicola TaxID=2976241 RepID=A0ABY6B8X3_9GAMM|nr:beta-ketoacyl synthase N-terminal-like domain-containing protein [Tahibacter amnicola]UXI66007.1 phosphopantetheine-binding protein [Tahibacter amnicola]